MSVRLRLSVKIESLPKVNYIFMLKLNTSKNELIIMKSLYTIPMN